MKKEDLIALGIDDDSIISKVLELNKKTLEGYVPKSRLDDVISVRDSLKATIADRDKQLETLKNSTVDTDALKQKIADLQKENTLAQQEAENKYKALQMETALNKALDGAGAKSSRAIKPFLDDVLSKAELSDDGTIKGLAEKLEEMKKNEDTSFLFNAPTIDTPPQIKGVKPANGLGNIDDKGTFMGQWRDAIKNNDMQTAFAIKEQAASEGFYF